MYLAVCLRLRLDVRAVLTGGVERIATPFCCVSFLRTKRAAVADSVQIHRELDKRSALLRDSAHIPSLRLLCPVFVQFRPKQSSRAPQGNCQN